MSKSELGIHTHEEWKGMTQPVGLVVEPIILNRLGIFPEKNIKVVSDLQNRLESLFVDQTIDGHSLNAVTNLKEFCEEVLGWQANDLLKPEEFYGSDNTDEFSVLLEDYGEVLKPDWIVPQIDEKGEKKIQILVKELEIGLPFDQLVKNSENKKRWEATPQQRFDRLLKETENPIGILWNGISLRLVYSPRGESTGHITFPLEAMTSVDGRPMISALEMLLGPDRLFEGGSSDSKLKNLMELSRKEQNEVSNRLAEQVLEALWILVRGFDEAEQRSRDLGKTVFYGLLEKDPSQVYGGLLTILLRLVFLLYSEDEELMPKDSLYSQNYSVSGLAARLRKDRSEFQSEMESRRGAWASLLSLFRLVYDGGGPYESYLPARHGDLFDPDVFPFLEGRDFSSSYKNQKLENIPDVSDDSVEKILSKLLILNGQILSYRSLDVEQIGSVYESIMGFTVQKAKGESVGIIHRPQRQKINITIVVNAEKILSIESSKREKALNEEAGVDLKLSNKIKNLLKNASNSTEICEALDTKLSAHTPRALIKGSLILQPTAERKNTGSHYTPRSLTQPIVKEVFRPWLESCHFTPTAEEILNLKICDPAMGSGAFLVETCRFLANFLVQAWNKEGLPNEFKDGFDKDLFARRLVSQRCLYGLDKNPYAVNLAKLSLWLVTLNKDLPFTFLDHSLKCGDSLVGYSLSEIQKASNQIQLELTNKYNYVFESLITERSKHFFVDSRNDESYDYKKALLKKHQKVSEKALQTGDLMVAAFFESKTEKERLETQNTYLSIFNASIDNKDLNQSVEAIRKKLLDGEFGIKPFHWDLEFPEVFESEKKGFDFFIGNPPFMGGHKMKNGLRDGYQRWLQNKFEQTNANADLSSFFFRQCFDFLRPEGSLGLIATNSIAQGETRETGLKWICSNGGSIFSAKKRFKWPGVAAVVVSVINIFKGTYKGDKKIDSKDVNFITAFLLPNGSHENPKSLSSNLGKTFQGSIVLGKGFTFDDSKSTDDETPGIPMSISTMKRLFEKDEMHKEVIFPYVGGDEINSDPNHLHHRYVVDFRDFSEEKCRANWPDLFNLLEKKVKPERTRKKSNGKFALRSPLPQRWWQHGEKRPKLYSSIKNNEMVLAATRHQLIWVIAFISSKQVFSEALVIFNYQEPMYLGLLQSQVHEIWANCFGSTLGDALRYTPTSCFETFPMPYQFLEYEKSFKLKDKSLLSKFNLLSQEFNTYRIEIMNESDEGMTKIYGRLHSPLETDKRIIHFRELHKKIDQLVLEFYEWEIDISYGFSLDHLDISDDIEIPHNFKNYIDSGDLFFEDANSAILFENEFNAITKSNSKLPWRFRWHDEIRDEILSRLLALNSERFSEEIHQDNRFSAITNQKRLEDPNFDQIEIKL